MTNYQTGHDAEKDVAKFLEEHGYKIHDINWKTKLCEIDIVAEKDQVIWFVEVKSRTNNSHGFGYEYVTPQKLRQMQFAAEMWVQHSQWNGDYNLAVASVDQGSISLITDIY